MKHIVWEALMYGSVAGSSLYLMDKTIDGMRLLWVAITVLVNTDMAHP